MAGVPLLKTDPKAVELFLSGIGAGGSITGCAGAAGLGESTVRGWLQKGRDERERLEAPGARRKRSMAPYLAFLDRYEKARGQREVGSLAIIRKAAQGGTLLDKVITTKVRTAPNGSVTEETREESSYQAPQWTAAAWILERTMPEEYSLKVRHGGDANAPPIRQELTVKFCDDWRNPGATRDPAAEADAAPDPDPAQ